MKLSDVVKLAEQHGYISVSLLMRTLEIDELKACRALQACWERGLIAPTYTSFFALSEDGRPVNMKDGVRSTERKLQWYRPELEKLNALFDEHPDIGFTVVDLADLTEIEPQRLRKVLYLMNEQGSVVRSEATEGGAFGRRPYIFSRSGKGIQERNTDLAKESEQRKTARAGRAKKTRQAKKSSVPDVTVRVKDESDEEWDPKWA